MAKAQPKQAEEASEWRDRIIEFRKMRVGDILPHPLQHKTHPKKQNAMLRGNLKETGKVDVLRAYYSERNGGKLTFFDGHGRRSLRPDEIWNIAICDLSDAEADRELLVFDAIGGYAQVERDLLDTLLRETSTGEAALQELMAELAAQNGVIPNDSDWGAALGGLPEGDREPFQQMTFTLSDEQAEAVKKAMEKAKQAGPFEATGNENSNGNALARIAEAYLG